MTNLFTEAKESTRPEDISNPFEHLVGEGKKYKDTNSLAFAALKKDEHISTIERENAEARTELERLRTELATRGTVEDALKRLQVTAPTPELNQSQEQREDNKLTPEQFEEKYKALRAQEREIERKQRNVETIHNELEKMWGKDYSRKLNELADELGGKEYLAGIAETNPKAFLRLVGADAPKSEPAKNVFDVPLTSRINTFANTGPTIKGHSYYQKIRRENPKEWQRNAGKYQTEMEEAAAKYGNAFFEN